MGNKVFVSYSRLDKDRVQIIVRDIEEYLGIHCWIDLTMLGTGDLFLDAIKKGIDDCELFLFMYTKNSEKSEFARREIRYAQDNNKYIILVLLEDLVKSGICNFLLCDKHLVPINDPVERTKLYKFMESVLNGEPYGPGIKNSRHSMVDLGLSVCWAEYNLISQDSNDYFLWGDTNNNMDANFHELPFEGTYKNIGGTRFDLARIMWGEEWRLPTKTEVSELKKRCKWEWIDYNGNKGYKVTGPNKNHIFLPASGYRRGNVKSCCQIMGCYWTDTINSETKLPFSLFFDKGNARIGICSPYLDFSIRPVYKSK